MPITVTDAHVDRARQAFADRRPASRAHFERARHVLPGGHTRTVLTHPPFPISFVRGEGAMLVDTDGLEYVDFLGDYTAGLLGHSERRVLDAVEAALRTNVSVGGVHPAEVQLGEAMCERFGLDRVRFTNSGTEANLMAITTARHATGRGTVLVFLGGYHGGVLYFASGPAPWNAPYPFVIAPFGDADATVALIREHADDLAAVLVEPMLGSGGCIPSPPGFVAAVFEAARAVGAVCIADEVMTSRHGRRGMVDLLGTRADITTFGKYIGGGFSFGAFGGRADLLDQYDTSVDPPPGRTVISHAGTFNNNIATMTAGVVVLRDVYTAEVADAHTRRGDEFRGHVADVLGRHDLPLSVTGFGSMLSLHATATPPSSLADVGRRDARLQELVHLGLLDRGIHTAPRGMVNLGLAHTDDHLAHFLDAVDDCVADIARTIAG